MVSTKNGGHHCGYSKLRSAVGAGRTLTEKLPMLANEMKRQGRRNMAETAMAWVTANKVSREEVREFTDRRGRINEL